jgi:hypothetical protein
LISIKQVGEVWRLPTVSLRMCGSRECRGLYERCTQRHRYFPLVQNKKYGVALIDLPCDFPSYLKSSSRKVLRNYRKRAVDLGYRFELTATEGRADEILAVNASKRVRQDREMDESYINAEAVRADLQDFPEMPAVFDQAGVLAAYAFVPICGEVANVSRILGRGDALRDGVMYLLVAEIIRWLSEIKGRRGRPGVLMYDTYFGGGEGLRGFKKRLGFVPYNVDWTWEERR